jgi:hypothetical protein
MNIYIYIIFILYMYIYMKCDGFRSIRTSTLGIWLRYFYKYIYIIYILYMYIYEYILYMYIYEVRWIAFHSYFDFGYLVWVLIYIHAQKI